MPISSPSEISREVDQALLYIGGSSLLLLLGVTGAMLYFIFRFNRKSTKTTSQIEGHTVLEVTWIVLPTILVTWFFFVALEGFAMMRNVPEDAMVVEVTGQQWVWTFNYPEEGISSTEMVVPVNTPVRCNITAPPEDVLHSFYLPDFRVKEDAVPGKDTYLWFESERTGVFNVFCAEFCGKDHARMITTLRVVTQEEYDDWVKDTTLKKYEPLEYAAVTDPNLPRFDELGIDGEMLYKNLCASCHGEQGDGSGLPGLARDFTTLKDWKFGGKVTEIYTTLTEGIGGSQMRAFPNLSPWEKVALAHKVRSFLGDKAPATTEADYQALVEKYGLDKITGPGETIPVEDAIEKLLEESGAGSAAGS